VTILTPVETDNILSHSQLPHKRYKSKFHITGNPTESIFESETCKASKN